MPKICGVQRDAAAVRAAMSWLNFQSSLRAPSQQRPQCAVGVRAPQQERPPRGVGVRAPQQERPPRGPGGTVIGGGPEKVSLSYLRRKVYENLVNIYQNLRSAKSWPACTPAFPRTGLREGNLARHGLNECKSQLSVRFRQPIYHHLVRIAM